jgi:hypothetical protein
MYIINLNFSVQNMLLYNIISKVLQFRDLRWYILQGFVYINLYKYYTNKYTWMYVEYYLKYNILYATWLYITAYYD